MFEVYAAFITDIFVTARNQYLLFRCITITEEPLEICSG